MQTSVSRSTPEAEIAALVQAVRSLALPARDLWGGHPQENKCPDPSGRQLDVCHDCRDREQPHHEAWGALGIVRPCGFVSSTTEDLLGKGGGATGLAGNDGKEEQQKELITPAADLPSSLSDISEDDLPGPVSSGHDLQTGHQSPGSDSCARGYTNSASTVPRGDGVYALRQITSGDKPQRSRLRAAAAHRGPEGIGELEALRRNTAGDLSLIFWEASEDL
eukprot:941692-Alexandrium_andersonii.AAC.1